jgi:hypothetical protein
VHATKEDADERRPSRESGTSNVTYARRHEHVQVINAPAGPTCPSPARFIRGSYRPDDCARQTAARWYIGLCARTLRPHHVNIYPRDHSQLVLAHHRRVRRSRPCTLARGARARQEGPRRDARSRACRSRAPRARARGRDLDGARRERARGARDRRARGGGARRRRARQQRRRRDARRLRGHDVRTPLLRSSRPSHPAPATKNTRPRSTRTSSPRSARSAVRSPPSARAAAGRS